MAKRKYISNKEAPYFETRILGCASQPPLDGLHNIGDIIISSIQKNEDIGWICIESGNPGKWQSIRNAGNWLNDKLSEIDSKLSNIETSDSDINQLVSDLHKDVEKNKNDISINKTCIADINNELKLIKYDIDVNATDIDKLEAIVNKNSDDIAATNKVVNKNSVDITNLTNIVNNNNNNNTTNLADLTDKVNKNTEDINKINNTIKENASTVINITKNVQTNTNNIEEMKTNLDKNTQDITDIKNAITEVLLENKIEVGENPSWKDLFSQLISINKVITPEVIVCTKLTLHDDNIVFTELNDTQALIATVTPENCTQVVTWKSSDESVAIVSNGIIVSKGKGNCIITATCGDKTASCSVNVNIEEEVHCTSITLDKENLTFNEKGATQKLNATVLPENCTDNIIWNSTNRSVATVDDNGVVTSIANGVSVITATCGSKTDTCNVVVDLPDKVLCTAITLDKENLTFNEIGATQKLNAAKTPSDCTETKQWTTSNENVAIVDDGVVTSVGEGECSIVVTCGSKMDLCNVVVDLTPEEEVIKCTDLSLSDSSINFTMINDSKTIIATILPIDCNEDITWSSSNEAVATVIDDGLYNSLVDQAKVDKSAVESLVANGIVTSVGEGECTITATCGSKTATCNVVVNVNEPVIETVVLYENGVVNEKTVFGEICINEDLNMEDDRLQFHLIPESNTAWWFSFDGNVDFSNYSQIKVTMSTEKEGHVPTISVVRSSDGSQFGTSPNSSQVTGQIDRTSYVYQGNTESVIATFDVEELLGTGANNNGYLVFEIINSVGDGLLYITKIEVIANGDENEIECTNLSLDKYTLTFDGINEQQTIIATISPENCTDDIKWESSNTGIATVDNGVVTSVADGECTITATCGDKTATCSINVNIEKVYCTSLTLDKESLSFSELGATQKLNATILPEDCTSSIIWNSTNRSVATVDDNGVVTSIATGVSIITATCDSKTDTCNVEVHEIQPITVIQSHITVDSSLGETNLDMKEYIEIENIDFNDITWSLENTNGNIGTINNEGILVIPYETIATAIITASIDNESVSITVEAGLGIN